jgi:hypothetical protein
MGHGPSHCAQAGRKFRDGPEVPVAGRSGQGPGRVRASQSVGTAGAGLDSEGRKFRAGRMFRGPEGPGRFRAGSGLNRELARPGLFWTSEAGSSGLWPEGPGAGRSGLWPEVPGLAEACPCFFFLLFQASLADGVVVHVRWHSSSLSVVLRQYLCMHTGEVSSSIPSSKGSSEHA